MFLALPTQSHAAPHPPQILLGLMENLLREAQQHAPQCLLAPPQRWLVAVSGGMDSTVLLHALHALKQGTPDNARPLLADVELIAVYVEHGWRPSPVGELPYLQHLTQSLQIPLVLVPPDATMGHTETLARQYRYNALFSLAKHHHATAILTAHHADDQVETLLYRILRGTGVDGLGGMMPYATYALPQNTIPVVTPDTAIVSPPTPREIALVRPLLLVGREVMKHYAQRHNLKHFQDPSNQDRRHQRNVIRHDVLPLLEKVAPHAKESLLRLGDIAAGDAQILHEASQQVWKKVMKGATLKVNVFTQISRAYQRRIVRRWLGLFNLNTHFDMVESVIDFLEGEHRRSQHDAALFSIGKPLGAEELFPGYSPSNSGAPTTTPTTLSSAVSICPDTEYWVYVFKHTATIVPKPASNGVRTGLRAGIRGLTINGSDHPKTHPDAQQVHAVPAVSLTSLQATTPIPELGVCLNIRPLTPAERNQREGFPLPTAATVWVDLSKLDTLTLTARTRLPGDRIQPLGMSHSMRLKNFMINRGISRFDRDTCLLLAHDHDMLQDILWVPGYGISERLRITDKPTHALSITPLETPSVSSALPTWEDALPSVVIQAHAPKPECPITAS